MGHIVNREIPGLLMCTACKFITADIAISQEGLEALYTSNYFAGEEYKNYVSERSLIERHFQSRLRKVLRHVPNARDKHLFEIGSAYGFFLSVARDQFASAEGIDISRDAAEYASRTLGLSVHAGDFLEYDLIEKIDVLCLWDTIEHLQSPELYLDKAAGQMIRGGVIAITTGDIGSMVARLRGAKWRQIHPPTHLHYFSKLTLARLLQNHGFTLRYCGHEGMYRSLDTIAYIILNIKHQRPQVYARLKKWGLLNFVLYLNLYDILFVIAEKT